MNANKPLADVRSTWFWMLVTCLCIFAFPIGVQAQQYQWPAIRSLQMKPPPSAPPVELPRYSSFVEPHRIWSVSLGDFGVLMIWQFEKSPELPLATMMRDMREFRTPGAEPGTEDLQLMTDSRRQDFTGSRPQALFFAYEYTDPYGGGRAGTVTKVESAFLHRERYIIYFSYRWDPPNRPGPLYQRPTTDTMLAELEAVGKQAADWWEERRVPFPTVYGHGVPTTADSRAPGRPSTSRNPADAARQAAILTAIMMIVAGMAGRAAMAGSKATSAPPLVTPPAGPPGPTRDRICDRGTESEEILKKIGIYNELKNLDPRDPKRWEKLDELMKREKNGQRIVCITFQRIGDDPKGPIDWNSLVVIVREPAQPPPTPPPPPPQPKQEPEVAKDEPPPRKEEPPERKLPPPPTTEERFRRKWQRELQERQKRLDQLRKDRDHARRQYEKYKAEFDAARHSAAASGFVEVLDFAVSYWLFKSKIQFPVTVTQATGKALLKFFLKEGAKVGFARKYGAKPPGYSEVATDLFKEVTGLSLYKEPYWLPVPPGGLTSFAFGQKLKLLPSCYGPLRPAIKYTQIVVEGQAQCRDLRTQANQWHRKYLRRESKIEDALADVDEARAALGLKPITPVP